MRDRGGRSNTWSHLCLKAGRTKTPQYFCLDSNSVRIVKGRMCIAAATNAFFTWSQECLSPGNADDEEVVDASLRHRNISESLLGMFQKISDQTSLPRDTQNKRRLQPDATDLAHKTVEVRHILVQFSSFADATQARKSETTFFVSSPHLPSSCIAS